MRLLGLNTVCHLIKISKKISSLVITIVFFLSANFSYSQDIYSVFITNSCSWTCPIGVSNILVECWGGGAAGDLYHGGAGGSYASCNYSVVPGNIYNITIGAGGVPISSVPTNQDLNGQWIYNYLSNTISSSSVFSGSEIISLEASGGLSFTGSTNNCFGPTGSIFMPGGSGGNEVENFSNQTKTDSIGSLSYEQPILYTRNILTFFSFGGGGGGASGNYANSSTTFNGLTPIHFEDADCVALSCAVNNYFYWGDVRPVPIYNYGLGGGQYYSAGYYSQQVHPELQYYFRGGEGGAGDAAIMYWNTGPQKLIPPRGWSTGPGSGIPSSYLFPSTMGKVPGGGGASGGGGLNQSVLQGYWYDFRPYSGASGGVRITQYSMALTNLNWVYDGASKAAVILVGNNKTINGTQITSNINTYVVTYNSTYIVTYNGVTNNPVDPGIYVATATLSENFPNYWSISNNLIISISTNILVNPIVNFSNTFQVYDGFQKSVQYSTFPINLFLNIFYNGSTNLPIYPGVYDVVATFQTNDLNLQVFNGSVPNDIFTNSLTITKATAELALDDLNQVYNGNPISVKKISEPKNLNTVILYNNSTNLPVYPGSYPVLATIVDSNYTGSATGTLIINKADPILTSLPKSTPITYGQNLASSKLFDGVASVPGIFYFLDPTFIPGAGLNSYTITFVPTNTTNYNIVYDNVNVQVDPAPAVITISNILQIYSGNPLSVSTTITPPNISFSVSYNDNSALPVNPGTYQVVARVTDPNYYGSTTNTLVIYPQKPTILHQPTNQTVARGSSVSFSVLAVGTLPLHYQWRSNLVNIASATNSTLSLNNVQTNASGGYRVVITNAYGSVTSSVAQLNVFLQYSPLKLDRTGLGTITGATNNQILTIGNLYKLSAKAAKGFVFKNWTNGLGVSLTNSTKLSFLMRSNLSLTANFIETSLPKLTITSPLKNAKLNGSSVGMTGAASDAWAVTNVSYSVNSGAWNSASTGNNYSNWTATVTLAAGTNTIRVYAQNQGGLSSLTNSLKVIATNVLTLNLVINSQNQAPMQARSMAVAVPASKGFTFSLELSAGVPGHIEYSTDLVHWTTWANFDGSSTLLQFNDPQAGESSRFYRAVTP